MCKIGQTQGRPSFVQTEKAFMNRLIVVVAALWTSLFALACGSEADPSPQTNPTDAGAAGEKTQAQSESGRKDAATSAPGQTTGSCSADEDCGSGHCVRGICCKQACTDPEQECRNVEDAT